MGKLLNFIWVTTWLAIFEVLMVMANVLHPSIPNLKRLLGREVRGDFFRGPSGWVMGENPTRWVTPFIIGEIRPGTPFIFRPFLRVIMVISYKLLGGGFKDLLLLFSSLFGPGKWSNLTVAYFWDGWFNHHLGLIWFLCWVPNPTFPKSLWNMENF